MLHSSSHHTLRNVDLAPVQCQAGGLVGGTEGTQGIAGGVEALA
jgi:hypothetical protein